jgi:hypothetical protein
MIGLYQWNGVHSLTSAFRAFLRGTFIFNVGSGSFSLHKALVARESRGLEAIMESGMKETQEGMTTLDTDVSTFGRFAEYVYTGDYNAAQAVAPKSEDVYENSKGGNSKDGDGAVEEITMVDEVVHEYPPDNDWEIPVQAAPPETVILDRDDTWPPTWSYSSKKKKGARRQPEEASYRYILAEDDSRDCLD